MGNTNRKYALTSFLALATLFAALPLCFAADSPQYIFSTFAVDSNGNPVAAVITPTDGLATIYIAATYSSDPVLTEEGFSCLADGQPRVNLNSVSDPINTIINGNGTTTKIYRLDLMVPDNLASPSASFVYFIDVLDGTTEVRHEATTPLVYTVNQTPTSTATATPTPTATETATATPTETASPSPTVPEFPIATIGITLIAAGTFAAFALKKKQTLSL